MANNFSILSNRSIAPTVKLLLAVALMSVGSSFAIAAEDDNIEEIQVTGSLLAGSPTDASSPVQVIDRADLTDLGDPTLTELIRNLGVSAGVFGETNQFQSNSAEGLGNINLRGLGASRTLVLMNGDRLPYAPYATGDFVDTNQLPTLAIERIEVLKEGAAAIYGSDAIGGVVNFITRKSFRGIEATTSQQTFSAGDSDETIGVIVGFGLGENTGLVASFQNRTRGELALRDVEWHIGRLQAGITTSSSIGNPGTFLAPNPAHADPVTGAIVDSPALTALPPAGSVFAAGNAYPDPLCNALGGRNAGVCRFFYTPFDNLKEKEEYNQLYVEFNSGSAGSVFHADYLLSDSDVPEWRTSPSYPPQALIGHVQYIAPTHPGLQHIAAMIASLDTDTDGNLIPAFSGTNFAGNPGLTAQQVFDYSSRFANHLDTGLIFWGRIAGGGGLQDTPTGSEVGSREYETERFTANWTIGSGATQHYLGFISATASHQRQGWDAYIDRAILAFRGFGGANCAATVDATGAVVANGATAGTGACSYYNPFSTALEQSRYLGTYTDGETNPYYLDSLSNSPELVRWIFGQYTSNIDTELTTFEYRFTYNFSIGNNEGGLALGVQQRTTSHKVGINDAYNLNLNPCANPGQTDCAAPTGRFSFLAGTYPTDQEQDVTATYAELGLPLADSFEVQLAFRIEDYGTTDTSDPKVAFRWDLSENITLRGSASSTFRGPSAIQLAENNRTTTLAFIGAALAFKAVDITSNPNLQAETADTTNFGIVFDFPERGITASIDAWEFDFSNPIITESHDAIVGAYSTLTAATSTADLTAAGPQAVLSRIYCPGGNAATITTPCSAGALERVEVGYVNGPSITTSGIDARIEWNKNIRTYDVTVGMERTRITEYDVGSYSLAGYEVQAAYSAVGDLNFSVSQYPIPEAKTRAWVRVARGGWALNVLANQIDEYNDRRVQGRKVDEFTTIDMNFNYDLGVHFGALNRFNVFVAVTNLLDEEPPVAYTDLGYDAFTHNPYGQVWKVGFTFGASR